MWKYNYFFIKKWSISFPMRLLVMELCPSLPCSGMWPTLGNTDHFQGLVSCRGTEGQAPFSDFSSCQNSVLVRLELLWAIFIATWRGPAIPGKAEWKSGASSCHHVNSWIQLCLKLAPPFDFPFICSNNFLLLITPPIKVVMNLLFLSMC